MTLGCGSWGGNVTSDNVSPIHLMDVKRVAFETRPVQSPRTVKIRESRIESKIPPQSVKREEIAAIVDKFLSSKLAETSKENGIIETEAANQTSQIESPPESPVKTIIHELKTENSGNGAKPKSVDFVSEDDVKRAAEKGEKIYVTAKTIITPSARDLGDEKEIFAKQ
jgi:hypothetical protein